MVDASTSAPGKAFREELDYITVADSAGSFFIPFAIPEIRMAINSPRQPLRSRQPQIEHSSLLNLCISLFSFHPPVGLPCDVLFGHRRTGHSAKKSAESRPGRDELLPEMREVTRVAKSVLLVLSVRMVTGRLHSEVTSQILSHRQS